MRRMLCTTGLALSLLGAAAGCQKQVVHEKRLPDPLLTSKKPVEGRPHFADHAAPPRDDIPPPPPPPRDVPGIGLGPQPSVVQLLGPRPVRSAGPAGAGLP